MVRFDLLRDRVDGRLHIYLQQVWYRKNLCDVWDLERGFSVCVQYNLCIAETWILRLNCSAFSEVIGHQYGWNWNIDRIAGLCQNRLIIAIYQVSHNKVTQQGGQRVGCYQLHD